MSSIVTTATCDATGKVKIADIEVPQAIVLNEGKKASSGIALIDDAGVTTYLTSNASDLKATIDALNTILTQTLTVITALDSGLGGAQASAIAAITTLRTQFAATKDTLK